MRRIPLALFLLAVGLGSARAGDAAPARYQLPFEVVYENDVDLSAAAKILRIFRDLDGRYPGLVNERIVKKVIFASPDRGLGNVKYCWNTDGAVVGGEECGTEHATVLIDLDTIYSFPGRYGDFYQTGKEMEAVVFHELLHGFAYTHPERLQEYEKKISDGRRTQFERKKNRLFKPLWAIERRMGEAREREEMGEDTKERYLAKAEGDFDRALREERWGRVHDKLSLEAARASLEKDEKKMAEFGPRLGARVERYNKRKNVPRRGERDIHAIENEQEWFAYGGEIANYASAPADFLTAAELAWWKAVDGELRGLR